MILLKLDTSLSTCRSKLQIADLAQVHVLSGIIAVFIMFIFGYRYGTPKDVQSYVCSKAFMEGLTLKGNCERVADPLSVLVKKSDRAVGGGKVKTRSIENDYEKILWVQPQKRSPITIEKLIASGFLHYMDDDDDIMTDEVLQVHHFAALWGFRYNVDTGELEAALHSPAHHIYQESSFPTTWSWQQTKNTVYVAIDVARLSPVLVLSVLSDTLQYEVTSVKSRNPKKQRCCDCCRGKRAFNCNVAEVKGLLVRFPGSHSNPRYVPCEIIIGGSEAVSDILDHAKKGTRGHPLVHVYVGSLFGLERLLRDRENPDYIPLDTFVVEAVAAHRDTSHNVCGFTLVNYIKKTDRWSLQTFSDYLELPRLHRFKLKDLRLRSDETDMFLRSDDGKMPQTPEAFIMKQEFDRIINSREGVKVWVPLKEVKRRNIKLTKAERRITGGKGRHIPLQLPSGQNLKMDCLPAVIVQPIPKEMSRSGAHEVDIVLERIHEVTQGAIQEWLTAETEAERANRVAKGKYVDVYPVLNRSRRVSASNKRRKKTKMNIDEEIRKGLAMINDPKRTDTSKRAMIIDDSEEWTRFVIFLGDTAAVIGEDQPIWLPKYIRSNNDNRVHVHFQNHQTKATRSSLPNDTGEWEMHVTSTREEGVLHRKIHYQNTIHTDIIKTETPTNWNPVTADNELEHFLGRNANDIIKGYDDTILRHPDMKDDFLILARNQFRDVLSHRPPTAGMFMVEYCDSDYSFNVYGVAPSPYTLRRGRVWLGVFAFIIFDGMTMIYAFIVSIYASRDSCVSLLFFFPRLLQDRSDCQGARIPPLFVFPDTQYSAIQFCSFFVVNIFNIQS